MLRVWQKKLLNNLLPANILEFGTSGTQQIYIPQSRYYDIDLVGAGAGGGAIYRQIKNQNIYARWGFGGGSGGYTRINRIYIPQGYITIKVGKGGTGVVQTVPNTANVGTYGGTDGESTTITIAGEIYSCEGGKAGYLRVNEGSANDTYRNGLGGNGTTTTGNNGQTIINASTQIATGGSSIFENKGKGGDARQASQAEIFANNGGDGFIRIKTSD